MKRRNFIRLSTFTAGAWLLTDRIPIPSLVFGTPGPAEFSPDPLLKISKTGVVTIFMLKQEMGQNVITSLPLIVAEELEIDPREIVVETLPYDLANGGNYTTWASGSVRGSWMHLRQVGATARTMLISAAATRWKVAAGDCLARGGKIINTRTNEALPYNDLLEEAASITPPEKIALKAPSEFKLVGKKMVKTNLSAILAGKYIYTMDVKLPGMLYAALVRCPVYHGRVANWDSNALNGLYGFIKILPVHRMDEALNRNAVAVIATNTWAALEGQRLLKVKWSYESGAIKDSGGLTGQFKKALSDDPPAQVFRKEKDAHFTGIDDPAIYQADYEIPYLAHATMEPVNCTAWYHNGKYEIWGGFQAPMFINGVLPKVFGIDPSALSVNLMPMGGSFGRKEKIDNVADVMQLTRALDAPIQMVCSRSDDMLTDFYRPASFHRLSAVSGPEGITQWRHQLGIATFPGKEISGPWHSFGGVTNDLCYTVGDYQSAFYPVESPIPIGSWRSISYSPNVFAIESFIDELAVRNHVDPVKFRLNILKSGGSPGNTRLRNVLNACADKIGWWDEPANGRFRGIACCAYTHAQAYSAHAIEISVSNDRQVKIHKCIAAVDCGLVIDPDGLRAQIEGSFAWALSIFNNEITIADGIVEEQSFADYQVLRMNEMPALEIILLAGSENPGGGGEPAVPSVGPALCNAIYAATGTRIRKLPIKKHGFTLL